MGYRCVGRYGFDRDATADRSRQSAIGYNVERDGKIVSTVTDGDVRRALLSGVGLDASVEQVMNRTPIVAALGISNAAALTLMRRHSIIDCRLWMLVIQPAQRRKMAQGPSLSREV